MSRLSFVLLSLVLNFCAVGVCAVPTAISSGLLPRDSGTDGSPSSSSINPSIWGPVLALALLAVFVAGYKWYRLRKANRSFTVAGGSSSAARSTRELTAAQLAGTLQAGEGNPRSRRAPRRARRTPSQISTVSLPVYMKEPGDQEVVIFRGAAEMEDGEMPVVLEDESDDHDRSVEQERERERERYPPMLPSSVDEVLQQQRQQDTNRPPSEDSSNHDDTGPLIPPHRRPPGEDMPRQSVETLPSVEDHGPVSTESSAHVPLNPPRYEEISLNDGAANESNPRAENNRGSIPSGTLQRRSSGFRTLFNAISGRSHHHQQPSQASSHTRDRSSSSSSQRIPPSNRSTSHHHTLSISTTHTPSSSSFIPSAFRLHQNARSSPMSNAHGLTSTSTLSLHQISAPLSHTLVRTEFTYPKTGPTPEQIAIISSRESFARFGVPYGREAIAFAASASRPELDVPPPGFDFDFGPGGMARSVDSLPRAGESPLGNGREGAGSRRGRSGSSESNSNSPDIGGGGGENDRSTATAETSFGSRSRSPVGQSRVGRSDSSSRRSIQELDSSPAGLSRQTTAISVSDPKPNSPSNESEGPKRSSAPLPPASTAPSFTVPSPRTEAGSSASSDMSYATAQEAEAEAGRPQSSSSERLSISVPYSSPRKSENENGGSPGTPRGHMLEATDATVVPGSAI